MALSRKLSSIKSLVHLQLKRFAHSDGRHYPKSVLKLGDFMVTNSGDVTKWKRLDSRSLGITLSMIPESPRIVLRILQNQGFDAYLVGGCVRDLLLNQVPKDFDVITSATLAQIKNQFHRAYIVGRRFPICRVHVRGSAIEVSSFETVARHATQKDDLHLTKMPQGYDAKDVLRWRNSLHRDFTINSLFYDPFAQRIYDYSNGIKDLRTMKLKTVVPAHLSFEEDCARILRGIRIAARLGLSFSKDTKKATRSLNASVTTLDKARLMMELNYMLSYGAAEPSFALLNRFNILELLLPFQAAYLAELSSTQIPVMLMKLLFNLDRVTSCDQPCNSGLWVSILAFHVALVNNPQDAIVVWAFSSLLYHGDWQVGVKAVREHSATHVHFTPEIRKSLGDVTDENLSQRVVNFASMVLDSIDTLTDTESLCTAMRRYPSFPFQGLALISKNAGKEAAEIFNVMMNDIESLREERCDYKIDYNLLGNGDIPETRFALGKIIMSTMRSGVIYGQTKLATEKKVDLLTCSSIIEKMQAGYLTSSISKVETPEGKHGSKRGRCMLGDQNHSQKAKKQTTDLEENRVKEKLDGILSCQNTAQKKQLVKNMVVKDQNHSQKAKKQTTDLEENCVKEKLDEILSCQDIAEKKQQLKKVVVIDVKKLLSSQEVTLENVKVELVQHCEAQTYSKRLSVLGKMASHREIQAPELILGAVENVTGIEKQRTNQFPEKMLRVIGKVPQSQIQQKDELRSLSKIFKGDRYPTKKDDREEKQATMRDWLRDESSEVKRARKLSSIFR